MASTHGPPTEAAGRGGATGGTAGVSAGTPSIAVGSYATPSAEAEADDGDGDGDGVAEDGAGVTEDGAGAEGVDTDAEGVDDGDEALAPTPAPASAPATDSADDPDDGKPDDATEADGPAEPTGSDASSVDAEKLPLSCDAFGCFGNPIRSAASCNHSGGLSRNDVWFRSIRAAGTAAWAGTSSAAPYSSSYRRITSPTGSPGHSVASPLSRAITRR
nr:hypothetical protein [Streptomyces sp. MSC1_001]